MSYKYFVVDSFTDVAFGGAPVAVFPDADTIPEPYLKALSEEVVAHDTVFIKNAHPEDGRFSFLSYDENGLCSTGAHELIAGMSVLFQYNSSVRDSGATIKIDTTEDCIEACYDQNSEQFPYVFKRKVHPVIDHYVPSTDDIANIIDLSAADIDINKYSRSIASCDAPYLIVPLKSYHAVREANFNNSAWSASSLPSSLVDKVLVFAPSTDKSGADFHLRLITRGAPAKSDPPVGDALPAFCAYLCAQTHVQKGTHSLTVKRGANEARQSIIHLEIDNTDEQPLNIRIGGASAVTSSGEIIAI